MTQTSAPKSTSWFEALKLFAPSLNQALLLVVTTLIGAAGTLGAQWFMTSRQPAPPPRIDVVKTVPQPASLMARLKALEDRVQDVEKKQAEPPRVRKAKQG